MFNNLVSEHDVNNALAVLRRMPAGELEQKFKDLPSATATHVMGHDVGGLFNTPAVEQRLFSAMYLPRRGLQDVLPVKPSRYTNPRVGIITGVTVTTGDEPDGTCDDPPTAGDLKYCVINDYPFGRFSRQTKVIDVSTIGRLEDRADFDDYRVAGNPFNKVVSEANRPTMPGMDSLAGAANREILKALVPFGVAMQRDFSRLFYSGNPTNNTPNRGYQEFRGLDLLINNSYSDMVSGNDCDRVDSYIASFSDAAIETNVNAIVRQIVEITNLLERRAEVMGLDPASWALSMPYNLFRVLVFVWASTYYTYRISVNTSNQAQWSGDMLMNLTLDMYRNRYLVVDGGRIPVITDDAITETVVGGGVYESEIKWIPLTVLGNSERVTYMEYFDYSAPGAALESLKTWGGNLRAYYDWFDNGRFMVHYKPPNNFCVQLLAVTEPRVRLDTPWLAARLTDIRYTPIIPQESPFPGDSTYLNGGNTGPNPGALGTQRTVTECADDSAGILVFALDGVLNCTLGTNVIVTVEGVTIPGVISAGNNSDTVTIDFTTAATPTFLQAVTCADFTFVGATVTCNW